MASTPAHLLLDTALLWPALVLLTCLLPFPVLLPSLEGLGIAGSKHLALLVAFGFALIIVGHLHF